MPSRRSTIALATLCFFVCAAGAQALPTDRTIAYRIFDDPGDPNAVVLFIVKLSLGAQESAGSSVGWKIKQISIRQSPTQSQPATTWIESLPAVGTPDGLWWVAHADPESPVLSEFTRPPLLSGRATAQQSSQPDLDYDLEGQAYTPPPGGPPFTVTAALDYTFIKVGDSEPTGDGEDEPTDMEEDGNPPEMRHSGGKQKRRGNGFP